MMRRFLSWPIRVHLLFLVLLLASPSITLILHWGLDARDQAIDDAKDECLKLVNAIAGEQQAAVAGVEQLLSTLALLPEVKSRNAPAANALLSDLLKKNPLYSSIGISDTSGLVWASATSYEGAVSVADRKYFREAIRSGMFSSGEFSVGRLIKKPVLNFAHPLMNASNELTGVIAVSINLDYVQSLFEKIKLPAGSSFGLLDHRGIILYRDSRDPLSEHLVGKPDIQAELFTKMQEGPDEGTYEAMGNDGKVRLTAYKKLRLPHESQPYLYIRSSIPKDTVVSAANVAMLGKMALLSSVFTIGLILAVFIGRRLIVDPITKLKEASRQLAAGPGLVNVSEQVKDGELGELAQAFDDMAQALLQKKEELNESERRERERAEELATTLEAVPIPVIIVHDPDSTHMTGNLAADELLQQPHGAEVSLSAPAEVKPRHFRAIKDGRELRVDELPAQRAARGEQVQDFEFNLVFDDGASRHLLGYGTPLLDKQGRARGAVHVLVDITERKRAEEELRASHDLLEFAQQAAHAGVWGWDVLTGKLTWSQEFFRIFGLASTAQAAFDTWLNTLHPDDREMAMTRINRAIEERTPLNNEYRIILPDGQVRWINALGNAIYDDAGQPQSMYGICIDITERKLAEEALKQAKESLELRVRERTSDLQNLMEQLERSRHELRKLASELVRAEERERKRIAGILHDDIAQTLATVRMRLDLLRGIPSDQEKTMAEAKALLLQSLQETRALMNDIGNPLLFEMGLQAACVALANRLMKIHAIRIHCDIQDAFKHVNPDVKTILYQVVRELLNNVVKHSQAQNANVLIDKEDGKFRVKVTDDGAGFEPHALGVPTLEGGFGLYSTRERLIAMDGSLKIESAPGNGTVVTAILPETLE